MNIKTTLLTVYAACGITVSTQAQLTWDAAHLRQVKASIHQPFYREASRQLMSEAESLLSYAPLSVMLKDKTPGSGDKHDYMSLARYFWPDPDQPDGLPYVSHDGRSNPELNSLDRNRLGATAHRVSTLTLAWYLGGDERYARKAVTLVRAWFLDRATRMNPNLNYAQMVPGRFGGKGRDSGVLDGYSFIDILNSVALLEQSSAFTASDSKQLKRWFERFLNWMLTSEQGIGEGNATNNHAVAYDAQILAYALYTGNTTVARQVLDQLLERRINTQIMPDGSQPAELSRTLAFGYSQYNITHFIDIAMMARQLGVSVGKMVSADGRGLFKAMDFLVPYMGTEVTAWPYQQIGEWDYKQQEMLKDYYRAATYLDPSRADYLRLFQKHRKLDFSDNFFLLYYKGTPDDDGFTQAINQMRVAVKAAEKAQGEPHNATQRRVIPRTLNDDGSLAMVGVSDWCCGFFPGSLWQLYAYTNDDYWRHTAISFTWLVEAAKWRTSTHDLGFMINDSFGKAYELTGERSYKDVVLQASSSLIKRFNDKVGCIRSWDHNKDRWKFPVIIDNMMNLEMLFRATQLTGDSTYWNIAVRHADTTMRNHFRSDYSSFHVVDYDPETGEVRMKCTAQGDADDSFWSRGQAWGLYGYTLCYRFTHHQRYLDEARHIAEFIMSLPMPDDLIPYWDMKSADIPNTSRDASAAAITASALFELANYVPPAQAKIYRDYASRVTDHLRTGYQAEPGSHQGFLLLHSTGHHPAGSEIDVPLSYADYYYLEALTRKMWSSLQ